MRLLQQLTVCLLLIFSTVNTIAQHKNIWEIASGDTAQQRGLYKQINNVLATGPSTTIEVVFHGNTIYAMLKDTGYHKEQIVAIHKRG